jgi:hypothetical protein
MKNPPVIVPGGNPVIESAGLIPTSPVTWVGPTLLTTGVAPRIPKVQAVPKAMAPAGGGQGAEVVKVQTKLAESGLPKLSFAPVETVAVYIVLAVSAAEGVKVAIWVATT